MRFKAVTVGVVLAGTALGSAALTLGRARGAAWIGQPLELTVPIQLDAGQSDGALCAEADVFHGDSRQDANRVQVQVLPTDQADAFNLRINSSALVDEPVVTVYLRAGCSQKFSRKFVLLADYPSETTAPLSRSVAPAAPQAPLVIPVESSAAPVTATQSGGNAAVASSGSGKTAKPNVPVAKEAARDVPKAVAKEAPKETPQRKDVVSKTDKPAEPAKPVGAGKPRLRLDPIEVLNERVKSLESTTTATAVQDDVARDSQKMQSLQSDLKTLLDQAAKNEASLMAMRERLEKAESERVPVTVVYGLAALVLMCMGALAYLLIRRPRHSAWDNPSVPPPAPANNAARTTVRAPATPPSEQEMEVDLVDLDPESFEQLMGQAELAKKA